MNWTGGNLSRVSKGANKDLIQRQKSHFAKSRSRPQGGMSTANEHNALALSPDFSAVVLPARVTLHDNGCLTTLEASSLTTGFRPGSHETDVWLFPSSKQSRVHVPNFDNRTQCNKRPRERSPVGTHRHRLLASKDWLGLGLVKPMHLSVPNAEPKHRPVRRRKTQLHYDMKRQPPDHRALSEHDASVVTGLQSNEPLESGSGNVGIRIGSRALESGVSSSSAFGSPMMLRGHAEMDHPPKRTDDIKHEFFKFRETEREWDAAHERAGYKEGFAHHSTNLGTYDPNCRPSVWPGEGEGALTTTVREFPAPMDAHNSFVLQNHVPRFSASEAGGEQFRQGRSDARISGSRSYDSPLNHARLATPPTGMLPGTESGEGEEEAKKSDKEGHLNAPSEPGDERWRQLLGLTTSKSSRSNSSGGRDEKLALEGNRLQHSRPHNDQRSRSGDISETDTALHSNWSNVNRTLVTSSELEHFSNDDEEGSAGEDLRSRGEFQAEERASELWKTFIFGPNYPEAQSP